MIGYFLLALAGAVVLALAVLLPRTKPRLTVRVEEKAGEDTRRIVIDVQDGFITERIEE